MGEEEEGELFIRSVARHDAVYILEEKGHKMKPIFQERKVHGLTSYGR